MESKLAHEESQGSVHLTSASVQAVQRVTIKHWRGHVLYECDIPAHVESGLALRHALEKAVSDQHDLRGADLSDADLRGADLRGAVLSGAVLRDADLSGAVLRGENGAPLRATPEEAVANLDKVREIILDDTARLQMDHWHGDQEWRERTCAEETLCGTTHCLAGWLQVCSTKPELRTMDAELAGILAAPVAAKMFFRGDSEVLDWLEKREYATEALGLPNAEAA